MSSLRLVQTIIFKHETLEAVAQNDIIIIITIMMIIIIIIIMFIMLLCSRISIIVL